MSMYHLEKDPERSGVVRVTGWGAQLGLFDAIIGLQRADTVDPEINEQLLFKQMGLAVAMGAGADQTVVVDQTHLAYAARIAEGNFDLTQVLSPGALQGPNAILYIASLQISAGQLLSQYGELVLADSVD